MSIEIDYYMGTGTFHVDMEASSTKTTYKGIFKVKCIMSPIEYIRADANYRDLLGKANPQYASEYVSQLCYALSQLRYRIIEAPSWFRTEGEYGMGGNVDDKILLYTLDQAVEVEKLYREEMDKRYKEAREEVRKAVDDEVIGGDDNKEEIEDDLDE